MLLDGADRNDDGVDRRGSVASLRPRQLLPAYGRAGATELGGERRKVLSEQRRFTGSSVPDASYQRAASLVGQQVQRGDGDDAGVGRDPDLSSRGCSR